MPSLLQFLSKILTCESLPPFSLIRDFRKQNSRGNVSKIFVHLVIDRSDQNPPIIATSVTVIHFLIYCFLTYFILIAYKWAVLLRLVNHAFTDEKWWLKCISCFIIKYFRPSLSSAKAVRFFKLVELLSSCKLSVRPCWAASLLYLRRRLACASFFLSFFLYVMKIGTSAYTFTSRRGKRGHWKENVALGLGTLAPFFQFFCPMSRLSQGGGSRDSLWLVH